MKQANEREKREIRLNVYGKPPFHLSWLTHSYFYARYITTSLKIFSIRENLFN